jgi:16S rRNA (cytosine967-C5)-methyltransferase
VNWQQAGAPLRAAAARALSAVLDHGMSLEAGLRSELQSLQAGPQRAYLQELVYGTLRYHSRLEWYTTRLLERPLPKSAREVHALILVGLYQVDVFDTPAHVAVSNTVEACRPLGTPWACALVNGVLRNFLRQRLELRAAANAVPDACHAHPLWLIDAVRDAWPERWQDILAANNARPPMTLRVNRRQGTRAEYQRALSAVGLDSKLTDYASDALRLRTPVNVDELPGFDTGAVSIQDEAAQLAAGLLDLQAGQRVLDACAAPGGKGAHMLEMQPSLAALVAVESDAVRAERLRSTLSRLQLSAEVVVDDALQTASWWDRQPFDRILLDAPCSATGVIRRHPDIKYRRRPQDIPHLAAKQRQLLESLWPLLKTGGKLLYATCSILPEENCAPVRNFLGAHPDATAAVLAAPWGSPLEMGRQILPGEADMDGFFYALLVKR